MYSIAFSARIIVRLKYKNLLSLVTLPFIIAEIEAEEKIKRIKRLRSLTVLTRNLSGGDNIATGMRSPPLQTHRI